MITSNHSKISDYPIKMDQYPLAKDIQFREYTLLPNQYIYIPKSWLHWIFTEPHTVSFHYVFKEDDYYSDQDECDLFMDDIRSNVPFTGESLTSNTFRTDDFFKENQNEVFNVIYSSTWDTSPVEKIENKVKIEKKETLAQIMNSDASLFKYAGRNNVNPSNLYFIPYLDINRIIYSSYTFECLPTLWFSIDKKIHSGLHNDNISTLIYVVSGKKTVLLAEPKYKNNLYFIGW